MKKLILLLLLIAPALFAEYTQEQLEVHINRPLTSNEVRFIEFIEPVMHRPGGTRRPVAGLHTQVYAVASTNILAVAIPQVALDCIFGTSQGESIVTNMTLDGLLKDYKTLQNGDIAFPLIATETPEGDKIRWKIVTPDEIAAWMPSLFEVAGTTDDDLLTLLDYLGLL